MNEDPSISMKLHSIQGQLILAACDRQLLGRRLNNGDVPFPISQNFYGGDTVNDDTFLNIISHVTSANIVGNHCVGLLMESGVVDPSAVMIIDDIMHVQIYSVAKGK
ncbi:MAG: DUF424 family protein [Candidatus Thermoplasmatota archaeon]|nr:DUF424 family protein [Candidatus Thermoplasmatota archaeon]